MGLKLAVLSLEQVVQRLDKVSEISGGTQELAHLGVHGRGRDFCDTPQAFSAWVSYQPWTPCAPSS